jgi:hypothetical protein
MFPFLWVGWSGEAAGLSWLQAREEDMGELETSAVLAMVLLSILRREMEDILRYLLDRGECTQVFNHLFLLVAGYTIWSAGPTK